MIEEPLESQLPEIRRKHPKMMKQGKATPENPSSALALSLLLTGLNTEITDEEIGNYNKELDKYYSQHEKYLTKLSKFRNRQRLTDRIQLVLLNEGTCPAEDIDIFIHFPDGFELSNEQELPKEPVAPRAPARPKTRAEQMSELLNGAQAYNFASPLPDLYRRYDLPSMPSNVSRPSIRKTKSYDVDIHIRRAKHGMVEELDPLYLTFRSTTEARSFAIEYSIHANNLPEPSVGKLHVIVNSG